LPADVRLGLDEHYRCPGCMPRNRR
jgi:hypothetical protein